MNRHVQPDDRIEERIRSVGLRATSARVRTLQLLVDAGKPMTHADVAEHPACSDIDKATAFRNLNAMAEAGLVRRTELGDHLWRFEAVDPDADGHGIHPHFLCVDCGSVACLDDATLTRKSLRESAKVGEVTEIFFRGHCNACRSTS